VVSLKNMKFVICGCALGALFLNGCAYKHFTHNQKDVLIDGVDIDQSLKIAEYLANRTKNGEPKPGALGYWVLRAQHITVEQAKEIERVYWEVIDNFGTSKFNLWHYTWAIADIYRLGNDEVKTVLQKAYDDAVVRAEAINREKFVSGETQYLGWFHGLAWAAARNYLVVPGNRKFTQSAEEYLSKKQEKEAK